MLGIHPQEIESRIDSFCFTPALPRLNINNQMALDPQDILCRIVRGVAEVIAQNNYEIEQQLRQIGILL